MPENEIYLSTIQAGKYLGVSPRSLEKWRVSGAGPAFARMGKLVKYRRKDLDAWAESRLRRSTSETVASTPWPPYKPAA